MSPASLHHVPFAEALAISQILEPMDLLPHPRCGMDHWCPIFKAAAERGEVRK